jgi:uncharacterized protein (DUF58 family)
MGVQARRVSSLFVTAPLLIFVGLVLFPALVYGQRGLAILCFLVFGTIGSLRLWGSAGLSGVKCNTGLEKRKVFAGESLGLHVDVENRKILPVWLEVKVPVNGTDPVSPEAEVLSGERGVLWYQSSRFAWELNAGKRGIYDVGPVKVMSGDLFGFFPKEREMEKSLEVVVYPRLVPLRTFSLPRRDFFGSAGAESPVKDPVYILGTTDYCHGRPARSIHWKASARHHRLQEKLFEPSAQEKILLVVDVEGFQEERAIVPFERTLEAAASLAVQLDRKGFALGLLTNGLTRGRDRSYLRVTRNEAQLQEILETFARLEARAKMEMADLLKRGMSLPFGVSCVYFGFEENRGRRTAMERLKSLRVPVTALRFDDICKLVWSGRADEGNSPEPEGTENGNAMAV